MADSIVTGRADALRLSPLHEVHVAAGASFTDFAGWQMPVRYTSELEEHHAVRSAAGLFDLSHMGYVVVEGDGAGGALDFALSGVASNLQVGQARYSLLLSPEGGVVDDVIVYRVRSDCFVVIANAGNRFAAAAALSVRVAGFDATVVDESDAMAILAVQGPQSQAILEQVDGLRLPLPLAELRNYRSLTATWQGHDVVVARTGYTGEDGFELYVAAKDATDLWSAITDAGAPLGLQLAGLACRDTLRLEAGMPLYGHELSLDIRPEQANLARVVKLAEKGDFVGRSALEAPLPESSRMLVGLVSEGRRAGRAGYPVLQHEGGPVVGEVTSGALSPTLGVPIALAFVDRAFAASGTELFIDVRGKAIAASVADVPFYRRTPTTPRKAAP